MVLHLTDDFYVDVKWRLVRWLYNLGRSGGRSCWNSFYDCNHGQPQDEVEWTKRRTFNLYWYHGAMHLTLDCAVIWVNKFTLLFEPVWVHFSITVSSNPTDIKRLELWVSYELFSIALTQRYILLVYVPQMS